MSRQIPSGFEPLCYDDLDIGYSPLVGCSIGHATRKFWNFNDKRFVLIAPVASSR